VIRAQDLAGGNYFGAYGSGSLPSVNTPQMSQAWIEYNRMVTEKPALAAAIYGVDETTKKIKCPNGTYRDPETKKCMPMLQYTDPGAVAQAINSLSGNQNFGESCAAGQAVDWVSGTCTSYMWPTDERGIRVPLPSDDEGRAQMIAFLAARRPDDSADFINADGTQSRRNLLFSPLNANGTTGMPRVDVADRIRTARTPFTSLSDDDKKQLASDFDGSWDPVHGKFIRKCEGDYLKYKPHKSRVCRPTQPQSAKYRLEYLQAFNGIPPMADKNDDDGIQMYAPSQTSQVWGSNPLKRFLPRNPVNIGATEIGSGKSDAV